jgi:hypothetical protein
VTTFSVAALSAAPKNRRWGHRRYSRSCDVNLQPSIEAF